MAIAEAALGRGARVTLIRGTTSVGAPDGATVVSAETAGEMHDAVLASLPGCDALIMAAAVADFRPRNASAGKIARTDGLTLELEPTSDILAEAAALARRGGDDIAGRPLIVGFAAETGSLDRAESKAARKGVDLLVANDVSEPGSGFGTDTNRVTLIVPGAPPEPWPQAPKRQLADDLLDRLVALRGGSGASLGT
jgi:phosphopantothenoylcysteine decarboxylase/phosphopantothenate--cysteine ligase